MMHAYTYRFLLTLALLCRAGWCIAQSVPVSATCNGATGICTGSSYSFPASTNAGTAQQGANYGCLKTQPNPAWFFMRIKNQGSITIKMSSSPSRDIDFILWGPFNSPAAPCVTGLDTTTIVDCSYSTASSETVDIPNAVAGKYYILLITNYSNRNTSITFSQTGGTGTSDCDVLCNITSLTAQASACDTSSAKGTYTLTGKIRLFSPPSSGTLTLTSSCGASVTYAAPFADSILYSIPGITGKGDSCQLTASFSAVGTCTKTIAYAAPSCCSVSAVSPISSCAGKAVQLQASGTTGGHYYWSGPAAFSATGAAPTVDNAGTASAGNYQVFLTYGSCTSNVATSVVNIKPAPDTSLTLSGPQQVCEGDSLIITAHADTGYQYQWQLNQVNLPSPGSNTFVAKQSGNYRVQVTGSNGCSLFSGDVNLGVNTYPDTTLVWDGPLTFCAGESVELFYAADSNISCLWYYNGVPQDWDSNRIEVSQPGSYSATLTRNGCSRTTAPVQVNVVQRPPGRQIRHE